MYMVINLLLLSTSRDKRSLPPKGPCSILRNSIRNVHLVLYWNLHLLNPPPPAPPLVLSPKKDQMWVYISPSVNLSAFPTRLCEPGGQDLSLWSLGPAFGIKLGQWWLPENALSSVFEVCRASQPGVRTSVSPVSCLHHLQSFSHNPNSSAGSLADT